MSKAIIIVRTPNNEYRTEDIIIDTKTQGAEFNNIEDGKNYSIPLAEITGVHTEIIEDNNPTS